MSWINMTTTAPYQVFGTQKIVVNGAKTLDFGGKTVFMTNTGAGKLYYRDVKGVATNDDYELSAGSQFGPLTGQINVTSSGCTLKCLFVDPISE